MKNKIKLVSYINPSSIFLPEGADLSSADDYYLEPLKSNIAKNGIVSPLIIRINENGQREVVCGKRRLLCARLLRMKAVPCVKIKCTETSAAMIRLSERISLTPADCFETAEGIDALMKTGGLSVEQAADGLGIPICEAQDKLRLLSLSPTLREKAVRALISQQQALCLLDLPESEREAALDEIINNSLGERQTEDLINSYFLPKKKEPIRKAAIGDIKMFSNSVEKLLYTLSNAGFETELTMRDGERFINYEIKIKKKAEMLKYSQMKIC